MTLTKDFHKMDPNELTFSEKLARASESSESAKHLEIGHCYNFGMGVTVDVVEAAKWYLKAAQSENAESQYFLGTLYEYDRGVDVFGKSESAVSYSQIKTAASWYLRSAKSGCVRAIHSLRRLSQYIDIEQRKANPDVFSYINKTEGKRALSEQEKVTCVTENDQFVPANYGLLDEIQDLTSAGEGWLRLEADKLSVLSAKAENAAPLEQYKIGLFFHNARVENNLDEAEKWWRKAAVKGEPNAQFNMGILAYDKAIQALPHERQGSYWSWPEPDYIPPPAQVFTEAARWWIQSAAQGHGPSQVNMGFLYEYGLGVDRDLRAAFAWNKVAAEKGHARAQYNLGRFLAICAQITGDKLCKTEADQWFDKAIDQGHADAWEAHSYHSIYGDVYMFDECLRNFKYDGIPIEVEIVTSWYAP